jgi:hypothetical protein
VCFSVGDQLLIIFLHSSATGDEYYELIRQLFIDFKKTYNSVTRELSGSIFIDFGVPMKLRRLIIMCLNEIGINVRIGNPL